MVVLGSLLLIFVNPQVGTDLNPPYNGAWRGVFWNKNHLGNLMPFFSMVFLFQAYQWKTQDAFYKSVLCIAFYLFSLLLLLRSNSASGYIVAIILHVAVFLALVWLRSAEHLSLLHYYFILAFFLLVQQSLP